MNKTDHIRVRHMIDAAQEALTFTAEKTRSELFADRQLVLALCKLIEILGEAATSVSEPFQLAHPQIPWRQIVGMRNRLVHGYFDVDVNRVWDTIVEDLPALLVQLLQVLPDESLPDDRE